MIAGRVWRSLAIVALLCASAIPAVAQPGPSYHVTHNYLLGGDGGWDYLTYDGATKRLFISRGTHVVAVAPLTGTVVGDIPGTGGVHGIAIAADLGKGFTSNGRDNTVTVFDLANFKPLATIAVPGQNPDAIAYDAPTHRVVTFNGRSHDATIIDARTDAVVATVPLGGEPEFAAADGKGMLYDNIEDTSEQVAIDLRAAKVVKRWKVAGCDGPSGLAMDQKSRRLFAGCANGVMAIVDPDAGSVVATVPIGKGSDAIAFDGAVNLVFSSNGGDGTLTVVHEDGPDAYHVVQNATTQNGARTCAVNGATHEVYLVTALFDLASPAPDATPGARPRRTMRPGTFTLLVVSPA
jgi:YVTN family beta-propeller protein